MTQKERIVQALKRCPKKGMSDVELSRACGIARPSARMSEMRRMGYVFGTKECSGKNIFGEKVTFLRYTLEREPEDGVHKVRS